MNRCLQIDSGGSGAEGRRYALSKVCGLAGSFNDSVGLLPSPGQRWDRIRTGICRRTASMRLRLLRICTIRLCALRLPTGLTGLSVECSWAPGHGMEAITAAEA